MTSFTPLGRGFDEAVAYAIEMHRAQARKSTSIPYASHILAVAALVMEDGGDEDEVTAALLHDGPEDQGGEERLTDIRERFSDRVAEIVAGCTDTYESPKPPLRARKEAYLERLRNEQDPVVLRVSLADKLHNATCTLRGARRLGPGVWDRFNAGRDDQLWYYRSLVDVFAGKTKSALASELAALATRWAASRE